MDSLPAELRKAMSNVEIVVEDEEQGGSGLSSASTSASRSSTAAARAMRACCPSKIAIYRLPLEAEFGDDPHRPRGRDPHHGPPRDRAHHFGIDEDRLAELGWSWSRVLTCALYRKSAIACAPKTDVTKRVCRGKSTSPYENPAPPSTGRRGAGT